MRQLRYANLKKNPNIVSYTTKRYYFDTIQKQEFSSNCGHNEYAYKLEAETQTGQQLIKLSKHQTVTTKPQQTVA